ncbi:MAG: NAD(P)-dependent oxidoreductase [Clostridiales bacterium]|nr:NAD(P)-dependent oxidoreductase [Clostridiales bacterium]
MRVVITGPTGAIGHALIEQCIKNGDEVLAICRQGSTRIKTLPQNSKVSVLELSLCDYEKYIEEAKAPVAPYDVFYHFAWESTTGASRNDTDSQSLNIRYALSAVKLADFFGCKTFIGAGSQAEYGRVEGSLKPDTPTFPENGYGIAKLCAGQLTRILCGQLGIKHIWTRILSVYGPYDGENSMVISSLRKMIRGEEARFTKGEQEWDYLFSADAARAMYLIAQKGIGNKIYVIGSGKTRKLMDYINVMDKTADPAVHPVLGAVPYADKQVMYLCADISELTEDTGFVPETDFEEGIEKTVQYVKDTNL